MGAAEPSPHAVPYCAPLQGNAALPHLPALVLANPPLPHPSPTLIVIVTPDAVHTEDNAGGKCIAHVVEQLETLPA